MGDLNLYYMKTCYTCNKNKNLDEFHNRRDTADLKDFKCKECKSSYNAGRYTKKRTSPPKTKAQLAEEKREQYKLNPEKYKERNKKWVKANWEERKKYNRAFIAKRRAQRLKATVPGFDRELKEIYENCPKGYHVDHIVPLKGKEVCGLHVPWNLQYLLAVENLKKGNKLIGQY
jgi:hypothetical protein